jgi:hypothetical protein
LLNERGISTGQLAKRLEIDEAELEDDFPTGLFVQVASSLGAPNFDELVGRIPHDAWVEAQSAKVLRFGGRGTHAAGGGVFDSGGSRSGRGQGVALVGEWERWMGLEAEPGEGRF